jgi:hypothetical protein
MNSTDDLFDHQKFIIEKKLESNKKRFFFFYS